MSAQEKLKCPDIFHLIHEQNLRQVFPKFAKNSEDIHDVSNNKL